MGEVEPVEQHHPDGSLRARGGVLEGQRHGYWEWFREDGSRMRSGSFDRGVQVGEWASYDPTGTPVRVTAFPGPIGSATDHSADDGSGSNTVVE